MAGMSKGQWRRWIETHRREVRIGRPITRDGRLARNRRLIHRDDLRSALSRRWACRKDKDKGEEISNPQECLFSCWRAKDCPACAIVRPKPAP